MQDAAAKRRGIYYGWFVVVSVATMLAITAGARFLFGVVLKPVSEEFGWPRADLAKAVTINVILLSCLQPIIGILVDRWGSRPILLLGPDPCHVSDLVREHRLGWQISHGDVDAAVAPI